MTSSNHSSTRLPPLGVVLLIAMALGWGINWPIMKIVIAEIPPLYFRAISAFFGGLGLLLVARITGQRTAIPKEMRVRVLMLSAFNIVGWNAFAIYGVLLLPSGRASLLGFTMPLWSALLSVKLLGETLDARRVFALCLGLGGIFALMGGSFSGLLNAPIGVLCMLIAAWSWAIGVVLFKRFHLAIPTTTLTGWTMILGAFPLFIIALPFETDKLVFPSTGPILGLIYNILIAFMFCSWAWNKIVLMVPVSVSSLSSLLTPLIGMLSGVLILGENFGIQEFSATLLILAAIATISMRR